MNDYRMPLDVAHALATAFATQSPTLEGITEYVAHKFDGEVETLSSMDYGATLEKYHYHRGRKEAYQTLMREIMELVEQTIESNE